VNRWRQRLDELQREGRTRPHSAQPLCSKCSECSKPPPDPSFELFEQIEQRTESQIAVRASWSEAETEPRPATLIAPMQWLVGGAVAADEPPYDEPYSARRGVIRYPMGRFEHFCTVCGAWGSFGYGASGKEPGRWYCFAHRPDSEP
jgi:hypothetical protein